MDRLESSMLLDARSSSTAMTAVSFMRLSPVLYTPLPRQLPRWPQRAQGRNPAIRDGLWFGLYTGMRREEVVTLRRERVDMDALAFRVEETKTGVPLEFPVTEGYAADWTLARLCEPSQKIPQGVRRDGRGEGPRAAPCRRPRRTRADLPSRGSRSHTAA